MAAEAEGSNKPHQSDFKQQTLKAWRPVLTPKTVLPTFVVVGAVFTVVGAILLAENNGVEEYEWDYTDCANEEATDTGVHCAALTENKCLGDGGEDCENSADFNFNYVANPNTAANARRCRCKSAPISLSGFKGDKTFLYYGLDNYYQNHRRYVDSRSDPQLRSKQDEANEECNPLESVVATYNDSNGRTQTYTKYYAPCGLIANSLFNDTILIEKCGSSDPASCDGTFIPLDGSAISWDSDRDVKFKNPDFPEGATLCDAEAFAAHKAESPPNWPVQTCQLGNTTNGVDGVAYSPWSSEFNSNGVGYENEDFIVWMRTAALPNFRKLYRKMGEDVEDGHYRIHIDYNYPVTAFEGKKRIIISTTSSIGGKNAFLGGAYITVGCLALAAATAFFIMMKVNGNGDRNTDINNMKW